MGPFVRLVVAALAVFCLMLPTAALAADWRDVTDDRLLNADRDAANWLMYNRTYSGWRYSPLDQVTTANVKKLVPKFIFAGGTVGDQQTTPIVNAKDGQELWSFNLGTPQSGGIISYAVDGKQYIAVAAGGTLRSQVWFGKEPKWSAALKTNFSDVVVVFGLSE